jgi:hypothetical protein
MHLEGSSLWWSSLERDSRRKETVIRGKRVCSTESLKQRAILASFLYFDSKWQDFWNEMMHTPHFHPNYDVESVLCIFYHLERTASNSHESYKESSSSWIVKVSSTTHLGSSLTYKWVLKLNSRCIVLMLETDECSLYSFSLKTFLFQSSRESSTNILKDSWDEVMKSIPRDKVM